MLAVHTVVDHKHLGHVAALGAYRFVVFASSLGIEHKLLMSASDPGRPYTPMTGFNPFVGPWILFKLYWFGWALLIAVVGRVFLRRNREPGLNVRLHIARHRLTPATVGVMTIAVGTILVGGFIFFNTSVRQEYLTAAESLQRRAEYQRRYEQYEGVAQPPLTAVNLRVEIYPERREAAVHGIYRLVNDSAAAIDAIHFVPAPGVTTGEAVFDRSAARTVGP